MCDRKLKIVERTQQSHWWSSLCDVLFICTQIILSWKIGGTDKGRRAVASKKTHTASKSTCRGRPWADAHWRVRVWKRKLITPFYTTYMFKSMSCILYKAFSWRFLYICFVNQSYFFACSNSNFPCRNIKFEAVSSFGDRAGCQSKKHTLIKQHA
jgi:hypothetical protein